MYNARKRQPRMKEGRVEKDREWKNKVDFILS